MKKIVTALAALSMLATPIVAEAGDGNHRRDSHSSRQDRHRDRGIKTGEAIAIGLGAIILGSIVNSSNGDRNYYRYDEDTYNYRYRDRDRRYRRVCFEEQVVEWHRGRRYIYYIPRCH